MKWNFSRAKTVCHQMESPKWSVGRLTPWHAQHSTGLLTFEHPPAQQGGDNLRAPGGSETRSVQQIFILTDPCCCCGSVCGQALPNPAACHNW